ncbi:FaeA/PapI family transcriptional regulator [Enterobacter hormaechei subsp. xiangfangensis]
MKDKACGLHTRLISDCCDIDIYRARYYLLKLERYGLVFRYKDNAGKLVWNATENLIPIFYCYSSFWSVNL